jgi:lipoprotein-anchoring transpeptidase ErfK/SrfK
MRNGAQTSTTRVLVLVVLLGVFAASAGVAANDDSARLSSRVSSVGPVPASSARPDSSVAAVRGGSRTVRRNVTAQGSPVRANAPIGVGSSSDVSAVTERQYRVVRVTRDIEVRSSPRGSVIGMLPARSPYLGTPVTAWVQRVTADGMWGFVQIPWSWPIASGWVRLDVGQLGTRDVVVIASLRDRRVRVFQSGKQVVDVAATVGAPDSPTPTGSFFVTERVPISPPSRSFGSYAFGLSTIQPRLPAGWSGGNQMAIHGTGQPATIGKAASAGCLRVSESALDALRPLLQPGTPVIIRP